MAPIFGETYHRAQEANSKEEFFKSKEAASAASAWGSSLAGSAIQTYGVAALINATGTLSYKGAAYLGALVFFASAAPSVSLHISTRECLFTDTCTGPEPDRHREAPVGGCRCRHNDTHRRDGGSEHVLDMVGNEDQPLRVIG